MRTIHTGAVLYFLLFHSCFTTIKPGACPQPTEGCLWAHAWFPEILFQRVCVCVCVCGFLKFFSKRCVYVCVCMYVCIFLCLFAPKWAKHYKPKATCVRELKAIDYRQVRKLWFRVVNICRFKFVWNKFVRTLWNRFPLGFMCVK